MTKLHRLGVVLSVALVLAAPTSGQPADEAEAVRPRAFRAFHTVRPGETLHSIASRYLKDPGRWRDLWALNPHVVDADRLTPGERLLVTLPPGSRSDAARVTELSGSVEGRPAPIPWRDAAESDLFVNRDGVRTAESSSASLEFADGVRFVLTESSLVFLRRSREELEVFESTIEILEGEGDIQAVGMASGALDIEVLAGDVRLGAAAGESGTASTRARIDPSGRSQVMVFDGAGEVSAGGQSVDVPDGMGLSVPQGSPPPPPKPLPPTPSPLQPDGGSELTSPIDFSWSEVAEAADYSIQLCHDPECLRLVRRYGKTTGTSLSVPEIPDGSYFWRVTAHDEEGLDSRPSESIGIVIVNIDDDVPPTGTLAVVGTPVAGFHAPGVTVAFEAGDAGSGLARSELEVDGEVVGAEILAGPWSHGDHRVAASLVDRVGLGATVGPLEFTVDATPPAVRWDRGGMALFERHLGSLNLLPDRKREKRLGRVLSRLRREGGDFEAWYTLAVWRDGVLDGRYLDRIGMPRRLRPDSDRSLEIGASVVEVLLTAPGLSHAGGGAGFLWFSVRDPDAGLEAIAVESSGDGIVLRSVDRLRNVGEVGWP